MTPLTTKQQKALFREQLRYLGSIVIQSLVEQDKANPPLNQSISVNWHKQLNLSPRLQTILAKMVAISHSNGYSSFQEIADDFKPLLKIEQIIGENYRLIRYLGEKSGIKTYLARDVSTKQSNSSLLMVSLLETNCE